MELGGKAAATVDDMGHHAVHPGRGVFVTPMAAVAGAGRVVDLFSGAGAFSFRVAEVASVHAVDGADAAIAALSRAVGTTKDAARVLAR
mgnify:CR=1 FL=1